MDHALGGARDLIAEEAAEAADAREAGRKAAWRTGKLVTKEVPAPSDKKKPTTTGKKTGAQAAAGGSNANAAPGAAAAERARARAVGLCTS